MAKRSHCRGPGFEPPQLHHPVLANCALASAATVITSCSGCGVRIFDQVKLGAQNILEVTRRVGAGVFGRQASENGGVGVAQRRNLRLRMIEVAAHVKIKYAPKTDKAHA